MNMEGGGGRGTPRAAELFEASRIFSLNVDIVINSSDSFSRLTSWRSLFPVERPLVDGSVSLPVVEACVFLFLV